MFVAVATLVEHLLIVKTIKAYKMFYMEDFIRKIQHCCNYIHIFFIAKYIF